MTLPAPTYDLMLLLDPQAEETVRAKIVSDAVTAIESQGELVNQADWGERALAYPIDRKANAEYHLLQFHSGSPALLEGLNRTLHITDGVLRHRIVKLKPGTPAAPSVTAAPSRPAEGAEQPAVLEPAAPVAEAPAAEPDAPAAEAPPEAAAEAGADEAPAAEPAAPADAS